MNTYVISTEFPKRYAKAIKQLQGLLNCFSHFCIGYFDLHMLFIKFPDNLNSYNISCIFMYLN